MTSMQRSNLIAYRLVSFFRSDIFGVAWRADSWSKPTFLSVCVLWCATYQFKAETHAPRNTGHKKERRDLRCFQGAKYDAPARHHAEDYRGVGFRLMSAGIWQKRKWTQRCMGRQSPSSKLNASGAPRPPTVLQPAADTGRASWRRSTIIGTAISGRGQGNPGSGGSMPSRVQMVTFVQPLSEWRMSRVNPTRLAEER